MQLPRHPRTRRPPPPHLAALLRTRSLELQIPAAPAAWAGSAVRPAASVRAAAGRREIQTWKEEEHGAAESGRGPGAV